MAGHPGLEVEFGRDLAIDAKLLAAAAERIAAAELTSRRPVARGDSVLVVVGRGANDPDANSTIAKVARMLGEGMGFGWSEIAFSGVAHPRVTAGLEGVVRLVFARIVVFPYFLFTGILVKRIYEETDAVAAAFPDIEFIKAPYLRDHPLVLDAFAERVEEIRVGNPVMNCQLCKYRTQIVGYGAELGAPQAGHHHHVRGIGTNGADHGHTHGDGHHHHHDEVG